MKLKRRTKAIRDNKKQIIAALDSTVQKLRNEVEDCHARGICPADYSLGFTNGMIFAQHKVKNLAGQPRFYDQKTSIGTLPKPVQFQHELEEERAQIAEYEAKVEDMREAARATVQDPSETNRLALGLAVVALDKFLGDLDGKIVGGDSDNG
jgi:hypothetical protein